jgi:N-acetylglucosamine-6-sulfatase
MRGRLLILAAIAMAAVGLLGTGDRLLTYDQQADAQTATRPNFVLVMTDDLDERSMGPLAGIRDVMGSNGTTFENAYVSFAWCCPSRATFLRGQYPHNHGVLDNFAPAGGEPRFRQLGRDQSTIATWLNDAGYQTMYVGKYLNEYTDLYKPPGWDEWFVLQGDLTKNQVNDNGTSVTLTGHSTDVFAQEASDFIRSSSANPEPFFVMIGTKAPHDPPEVADRYKDRFATTPLPKPSNFNEADVSDKPQWVRSRSLLSQTQIDEIEREYRARLRSMLSVEDLLKETIATLQETGELSNTYIVFTSDNGYHMGNHRLPTGKRTPYEEDTGVPLMVRGPGVPAGAVRKDRKSVV